MSALFTDVWALSLSAGLLLGFSSFFLVLKHYRASVEDESPLGSPEPSRFQPEPEPVRVVAVKDPGAAKLPIVERGSSVPAPQEKPAVEMSPNATLSRMDIKTSTGSLSPAVVYLQNLKMQMEHFEKEIHTLQGELSGFVQRHDNQFDALLSRLGDLQKELHQQVSSHIEEAGPRPSAKPAPVPAPNPAPAEPPRRREPVRIPLPENAKSVPVEALPPAPVPLQEAPKPEPTMPIQISAPKPAEVPAPVAAAQPPASAEPAAQPPAAGLAESGANADETLVLKPGGEMEAKKRGPVWPV